jgi:hypothetical protein
MTCESVKILLYSLILTSSCIYQPLCYATKKTISYFQQDIARTVWFSKKQEKIPTKQEITTILEDRLFIWRIMPLMESSNDADREKARAAIQHYQQMLSGKYASAQKNEKQKIRARVYFLMHSLGANYNSPFYDLYYSTLEPQKQK